MADEIPPTTVEKPPETPPAPATPPTEPEKEPEKVAKESGEKVPEWGSALIDKVDGISGMLDTVLSGPNPVDSVNKDDETPAREPWHKRGIKR